MFFQRELRRGLKFYMDFPKNNSVERLSIVPFYGKCVEDNVCNNWFRISIICFQIHFEPVSCFFVVKKNLSCELYVENGNGDEMFIYGE